MPDIEINGRQYTEQEECTAVDHASPADVWRDYARQSGIHFDMEIDACAGAITLAEDMEWNTLMQYEVKL